MPRVEAKNHMRKLRQEDWPTAERNVRPKVILSKMADFCFM